jgi:cell division protein FtsL
MTKLNVLLLAALLASCFVLIRTAHESRQVFTALDRAHKEKLQLDAEFRRLDAERQTQATHQKIGKVAAQRLKMMNATREQTVYVDNPAVAVPLVLPPTSAVVAANGKTGAAR